MKLASPGKKTSDKSQPVMDPDLLLAMEDLELAAQGVVEGFMEGRHRSPFVGFSVEFDSHREYQRGDDVRHINWKLWARQDRLYVKQFNADTNLNLYLLLDASGSMSCDHGPSTKWRYATRAAAALAFLALRGRDAPGVTLLGDGVIDHFPARVRPDQFHRIAVMLEKTVPKGGTRLVRAMEQAAELCLRRGLVVFFSDLFDNTEDIMNGLDQFRYRGHEVLVVQILDPWERDLPEDGQYRFLDLESRQWIEADAASLRDSYREEVQSWTASLREECEIRGIDWLACSTSDPLRELLVDYLAKRSQSY
jgi:uncharacterized protein (DUF58 family)